MIKKCSHGPDFGYYFTGRILHETANGTDADDAGMAESFNSYTTLPMSISPQFGAMLADRLNSMWNSMGQPKPFFLFEFGGGTGVLARDVLSHIRAAHADFWDALGAYILGERSAALRSTQRQTAAQFVQKGSKMHVVAADARNLSA